MNLKHAAMTAVPLLTVSAFAVAIAAPVAPKGHSSLQRAAVKTAATTSTLYGGGATLPALGYVGTATVNPQVTDATGSAFYYFTAKIAPAYAVSYCQTGSGFGKKVDDGVNNDLPSTDDANLTCPTLGTSPVVGTNGFAASGQNVADFSGSDAPFEPSEYSSYTTNGAVGSGNPIAGRIEPVQLPVVAGSIAIYSNNKDAAVEALKNLPLTDEAICKIATGSITNWSALYTELSNEGQNVGTTPFASKNLYFVSRYDGSGTSFSFTNHLAAVCGNYGISTFGVNQTYSKIITANPTGAFFTTGSGNAGVVTCVMKGTCLTYASASPGTKFTIPGSGDGSIGYVETANVAAAREPESFATVNGFGAEKDLPHAGATVTASDLVTDMGVNETTGGGGPATLSAITPTGAAGCLVTVNPSTYANPSAGYPIIAVSNLEFATNGNLGKSAGEQALAKMFYTGSSFGTGNITSITREGIATGATGYSSLPLVSTNAILAKAIACISAN